MPGCREDHAPSGILDRQLLLLGIDINLHIGLFYRDVVDVDPLRECLFDFVLLILDADGIAGNGGDGELSVSKRNGVCKSGCHEADGCNG